MTTKTKLIIFAMVMLAVGAIFVIPSLNLGAGKTRQFSVTQQPAVKLKEALENNRPVFLEFYSFT